MEGLHFKKRSADGSANVSAHKMLGPLSSGSSALLAEELRDGHTNAGRHRLNVGAAYDQIPTPDQKRNAHIFFFCFIGVYTHTYNLYV